MPKSLPYVWLFLVLWLVLTILAWLGSGDGKAYIDTINGPQIKFQVSWEEQLIASAIWSLIAASFITVLVRWIHLWLAGKRVPMG